MKCSLVEPVQMLYKMVELDANEEICQLTYSFLF